METLVNTELLIQDFMLQLVLADHPALKASSPQAQFLMYGMMIFTTTELL